MAKLIASSAFDFNTIKEGGAPRFASADGVVTVTFPNKLVYTLTAAPGASLTAEADNLVGLVGEWSGTFKGKAYFSLSEISYDMGTSGIYDTGFSDGNAKVGKLAAEVAFNLQGNDEITGSSASDKLAGFQGDDLINGGAGKDFLTGGSGKDTFEFSHVGPRNADIVTDFTSGDDKIALDASVFMQLPEVVTEEILVVGNKPKAIDAADRLIFDAASGNLYYDADGSGKGKAQLIAKLSGVKDLEITDFVITDLAP